MERSLLSNVQFPEPDQLHNRLRTAFDIQLLHHVGNVIAYGFFADKKLLCNVPRCLVLNQKLEYFPLASRQQELIAVVVTLQVRHPSLLGIWIYKVKGYSQHIL